ncbi:PREDICTED: cytochrome P450 3A13-like [Branchiostoma belcheri]|uniref:Cytochrome P450 3A13-like n=1 Tax=Branchiostoma belcheri TaxID=7741 RepID=A0A6P4YAV1_BRABE|nr:PREDICTED: cytochrome P450 3A13-like [Branchiostoma belcheri]
MALEFLPIPLSWLVMILLPVLFYIYCVHPLSMFKKMGVEGPKPYPVIGNFLEFKNGLWDIELQTSRVKEFGGVYGVFGGMRPAFVVTDREFLREIFIKQFHNFTDRSASSTELEVRPVCRGLANLRGDDWKNVRATLSPAFTGGKLKLMTDIINQCADQLVDNIGETTRNGAACDIKEHSSAFTMDAIAAVGFGTDINTQETPDHPFVVNAKKAFSVNLKNPLVLIYLLLPKLVKPIMESLQVSLLPRDCVNFFSSIFTQLMQQRQTGGQGRVDMMQLMMDAHTMKEEEGGEGGTASGRTRGKKQALTRDDVLGNGFQLILAGYETTASMISFTLYQLARHPDVQDRVVQEVDQVMKDRDTVDYEACKQLEYLEMCIMENLRIYPPGNRLARVATADTKIQWLTVPKGMLMDIPVLPIHYDPQRYPEPHKFIPERFSKEERQKRDPCDWMPFGAGPRNCIGMRLAMMEAKIALAKILSNYRIALAPDMEVPVQLSKFSGFLKPEHGIRITVQPRNSARE